MKKRAIRTLRKDRKGSGRPLHGQLWDAKRSARMLRDRFAFHRVPQPTRRTSRSYCTV